MLSTLLDTFAHCHSSDTTALANVGKLFREQSAVCLSIACQFAMSDVQARQHFDLQSQEDQWQGPQMQGSTFSTLTLGS